jgi:hypothetical protein
MGGTAARTVMPLLLLAGLALALGVQSAAARGGSGGVTVIVNGDRLPVQRLVTTQGKHHFGSRWTRTHRFGGSAVDQWRRHSRHDSDNVAVRAFQRSAAHHAGFHSGRVFHSSRGFHKPPLQAHARHTFKAPRIILVAPPGAHRAGSHGVVVLRGSGAQSLAGGQAPGTLGGGKLIVLSSSPRFKHIVVVPSHRPAVD